MKLFNTSGRGLQVFEPLSPSQVSVYTCGPTVYDYQHIGNYSGYIYWDILVRLLKQQGYKVKRVMNITDVGHLMSDGDEGDDKLEKGSTREGKSAREIADFYAADFTASMKQLKMVEPDIYAKATDYIDDQVAMIKELVGGGFAYVTDQAVYFDVSKLSDYGALTGQKLDEKEVAARPEVITDPAKHHPQDFGLWFFRVGRFANHQMHWPSPWGEGFPGWHIECSAIVHATLGEPVDIHTGGVDHIGTHHPNEIAQTEAAYSKQLAKFWLHNNHMMVDGKKMAKSAGNFLTLKDLADKGFSPMDFKMLVLQSHYRSQSNFTWEALDGAKSALQKFYAWSDLQFQGHTLNQLKNNYEEAVAAFIQELGNDINTPSALAILNGMVNQIEELGIDSESVGKAVKQIDELLGLDMGDRQDISEEQKELIAQRGKSREAKDWPGADKLRQDLARQGILIKDTPVGQVWARSLG